MTWQEDYIRNFDEVAIRHGWRDEPLSPKPPAPTDRTPFRPCADCRTEIDCEESGEDRCP